MLSSVFVFLLISALSHAEPEVTIPLGTIRGTIGTSEDGRKFSSFEGIPYAKAPIKELRFAEPQPAEPWSGVFEANKQIYCAQTLLFDATKTKGVEDCLVLNIYVPGNAPNPSANLDVIVSIHGGGFMYASGIMFRPEIMMDRDVVAVTLNYRLGMLGFLSTEDETVPGNMGLKDQVLALKWVQDHIKHFGGNPNSVTIVGVSAGASSVHFHYLSPLSKGLFHRGFSQSGVALNPWALADEPLSKAKKLANAVGCSLSTNKEMVECLKTKTFEELLDKMPLFFGYKTLPVVPFGPVVEPQSANAFISENPFKTLNEGKIYDVPWLTMNTIHEGAFPVLYLMPDDLDNIDQNWETLAPLMLDFNYTAPPESLATISRKIKEFYFGEKKIAKDTLMQLIEVFSDRYFTADAETAIKLQAKVSKSPVYFYIFGYPGDNNPMQIVAHALDIKYMWGPVFMPVTLTENEKKMSKLLVNMLVTFASTGKPEIEGVDWQPTKPDEIVYVAINGFNAGDNSLKRVKSWTHVDFWKSLGLAELENYSKR